jgi:hypothetical protein
MIQNTRFDTLSLTPPVAPAIAVISSKPGISMAACSIK